MKTEKITPLNVECIAKIQSDFRVRNFSICTMRLLLPAACPVPSALPILLLNTINLNEPKELFKFHLAWGTAGTWHLAPGRY